MTQILQRPTAKSTQTRNPADARELTQHYLAATETDWSLRQATQDLVLTPALRETAQGHMFERPLFIDAAEIAQFTRDLNAVFDMIANIPAAVFQSDYGAFQAALQVDAERSLIMASTIGLRPPRYGRADMYHDGTAFRLLEFNIGSEVGGIDRCGELPRAFQTNAAFAGFAEGLPLHCTDTAALVAETLRRTAFRSTHHGRPITVALLDGPGSLIANGGHWLATQEILACRGVDVLIGEVTEVAVQADGVYLAGQRVDVVLRYVSVAELVGQPDAQAALAAVTQAAGRGVVGLWTPPSTTLYGNKACLALLSSPEIRRLNRQQAEIVDRVLPWTRSLNPALPGRSRDSFDRLIDYCLSGRAELVLKPNADCAGRGVVAGWECTEQEWESNLQMAVESAGGYIVQRRVRPRTELLMGDGHAAEAWHASWGMFLTPCGYAGTYARVLPAANGAVIGLQANRSTRTAAVLEYRSRHAPTTVGIVPSCSR